MATKKLLITDRKKVIEAYGKSEKEVSEYVGIIRDWLKTQPHLPETPNDHMIETFLVMNKFSVERTKPKLDMYYSIRSLLPELYEDKNPSLPHMQEVFNMAYCIYLPKLTKQLYRVIVMKVTGDPENYDSFLFFSHLINLFEVRVQEDICLGDVYIVDYEHLKMGHVRKITLMHVKKGMTVSEKVFSARMKEIHIVNSPPYVDILLNIAKLVFKPKLLQRIHMHNSFEEIYEHVPKEILPKDYGGEEISLEELNDLWKLKLAEYKNRFDTLDKLRVKEELRPEPLKNDDLLGFHGNFMKLDVD